MNCKTGYYTADDGLELFYRDYPGPKPECPAILCLPGLTRNCRDFVSLAEHLQDRFRVITPDLRGRGRSQRDPDPENYQPPVYVKDAWSLLEHLDVERAIVIGTSLGGLMAMMMAAQHPDRLVAAVLNDVGPELGAEGVARIKGYVGRQAPVNSWPEAARRVREIYGAAFPDYDEEDWDRFARRTYRQDPDGQLVVDMDPAIGDATRNADDSGADLWPLFEAMTMPVLVVRGALSDILTQDTLAKMQQRKSDLEVVTLENRGHAPELNEPEALAAIDGFLASSTSPSTRRRSKSPSR